jgi:ADP-glucose pyrophosphorylase
MEIEMSQSDLDEPANRGHDDAPGQKVTIHVNEKPVKLIGHIQTGLQIKQAAIAQGVKIELDFVLSEELSHDRTRIIADDQRVAVTNKSRFDAIPNDDQS